MTDPFDGAGIGPGPGPLPSTDPGRSRFAGAPITDDDATIAAALEDLSIPTLLMSMVHMTGDPRYLRWEHVPAGIYLNEVQGYMPEESQAAVRAEALRIIAAYRDGGCVLPPPPDTSDMPVVISVTVGVDSGEDRIESVPVGSVVSITITNPDSADEFHLHGYDLGDSQEVAAGESVTFTFTADTAGEFELESHSTDALLLLLRVV